MFDPHYHRLEVLYIALRRWQDELCRVYGEPDPVRREARRQEALGQIDKCWEKMMEVLGEDDGGAGRWLSFRR